ncbi:MAG: peptidase [Opitutae bacterium]|nr:peptidase [Opitutae bacterium]
MTKKKNAKPEKLSIEQLIGVLPAYVEKLKQARELFLANVVMFGEIPGPTFRETRRSQFMLDRFHESDLHDVFMDESGNASAILPGTRRSNVIMVSAHADTVFEEDSHPAMLVGQDSITGPAIADNSLGLATVASLPMLLDRLGIRLADDLLLVGTTRSLGRGNLDGMKNFLSTRRVPIRMGICVEGADLGRLSYSGLGMVRGEIQLKIPPDYDWNRFGASGAIGHLARVVNSIMEIPIPREPKTRIAFGSLRCGTSYDTIPRRGALRFEIRSEDDAMLTELEGKLKDMIDEFSLRHGAEFKMEIIARGNNCCIPFSHPLVKTTRQIMDALKVDPIVTPSSGDLSALIDAGYPGVTLGISRVENSREENETISIEPIFRGLAQLVGLLCAIDSGHCDES